MGANSVTDSLVLTQATRVERLISDGIYVDILEETIPQCSLNNHIEQHGA